jgi:hypothetical protein
VCFSATSFAAENLSHCANDLMSEPLCITKINAKSFCKMMGDGHDVVDAVSGCFKKLGPSVSNKQELTMVCLAGYKTSSRPSDNETFCQTDVKPAYLTERACLEDAFSALQRGEGIVGTVEGLPSKLPKKIKTMVQFVEYLKTVSGNSVVYTGTCGL